MNEVDNDIEIDVSNCLLALEGKTVLELARLQGCPLGVVNLTLREFQSDWDTLIKHNFASLTAKQGNPFLMCLRRIENLCLGAVALCITVAERESCTFEAVRAELGVNLLPAASDH